MLTVAERKKRSCCEASGTEFVGFCFVFVAGLLFMEILSLRVNF